MKRLLLLVGLLAACGPIPLQQAEKACFERARLAQRPRGEVFLGANSNGKTAAGLELDISSDFLQGRDPSAVYDQCVYQRSGQPPSQPLYSRPDWKS